LAQGPDVDKVLQHELNELELVALFGFWLLENGPV